MSSSLRMPGRPGARGQAAAPDAALATDHHGATGTRAAASDVRGVTARINIVAGRQHGIVSRRQLVRLGMPLSTIDHRVRSAWLVPVHRGVYRVGPLTTPRTPVVAAVLALPGSVVSHVTAGALWDVLKPQPMRTVEVTIAGRRLVARRGIRIHHVASLDPEDVVERDGLPVTSPLRTLCDLAPMLPRRELERALAEAFALRLVDRARLAAYMGGRADGRGMDRLRALVSGDTPPARTRSEAEDRFLSLIRRAGVNAPAVNAHVAGYEVDFFWEPAGLIVEVDGHAFHGSRRSFESDRRRDAVLIAAGLRVMRVTWMQLRAEPERVLANVVRALAGGVVR